MGGDGGQKAVVIEGRSWAVSGDGGQKAGGSGC